MTFVQRRTFCYGSAMLLRTSFSIPLLGYVIASLCMAGCGGRSSAPPTAIGSDDSARTGAPDGWPRVLVVGPGTGPALFLGPENESPAIGYISTGTRVRIDGPPQNRRVPVTVAGGLSARGWIPLGRVGAYTSQRGRIEGTPTYVGVGDFVSILDRTERGFRVEIAPWLGRTEEDRLGPWTAELPADWLTDERPSGADSGLNPGANKRLPLGREIPVYDRPNGSVIATIPPSDPPHTIVALREQNGWSGVRVGVGPFLVGYVQGEFEAAEAAPAAVWQAPRAADGEMPIRIAEEQGLLHRVSAGTRVKFLDRVIGRLRGQGWARELSRVSGGRVDVFIAIDDSTAIRGLVQEGELTQIRTENAAETSSAEP